MNITRHDPSTVHAPSSRYTMGLELNGQSRLLFISGQVPAQADARCRRASRRRPSAPGPMSSPCCSRSSINVGHLVKVTTFLTDRSHVAANGAIRRRVLGAALPVSTVMIAETLDSPSLLEIQAIAAA